MLLVHGAGGGGVSPAVASTATPASPGGYRVFRASAEVYPTISADLGVPNPPTSPTLWGNATVVARIEEARLYLGTALGADVSKVILIGGSAGTVDLLSYARQNPTKVQAIAAVVPCVDLNNMYQNNVLSLQASIGTAWGVTYPTALPANSDPMTYTASLTGIPFKCWYASDDAVSTNIASFCTSVGGTAVSVGALGHTDAAIDAIPTADLLSFLNANA